jgi:H+/Cl- antiporter ClcA
MGSRKLWLYLSCSLLGVPVYFLGRALLLLIAFFNNALFHGFWSFQASAPPEASITPWAILVPALGGLLVGLIARHGSPAVRGHGIPEVIESVVRNESRMGLKTALLKPLCSAIAIGSGAPFGAEGPVIALGASTGSLLGQWESSTSAWERKVLLSSGAAAGITAVFGCPVGAALLSVELLLFEFSVESIFAVSLASLVSAALRAWLVGSDPLFPMPALPEASAGALLCDAGLGLPLGLMAVLMGLLVHNSEKIYSRLPLHWMWWPAVGGLIVGGMAYFEPRILGPSYDSIGQAINGSFVGQALLIFMILKLVAWVLALGSGTAGGTLAPMFAIGGALGALLTGLCCSTFPQLGLDPRLGALIGMAAVFAGCSHAPLASLMIGLETTHQISAVLPLFSACMVATATTRLFSPYSLMTAGLVHKGISLPGSGHKKTPPKGQGEGNFDF